MKKPLVSVFVALFLLNCKEPVPIGKGFVLNSPVSLHKKPDGQSETLKAVQILTAVDLLKLQVPDKKNEKLFWFKVKHEGVTGFISYDEEILKQNFVSLMPSAAGQKALTTAGLKIREQPTQKAKSIGFLEKGSVVDIAAEGSLQVTIDKITDSWIGIKTPDQKTGYVFAGYVKRGTSADFDSEEKRKQTLEDLDKGFARIKVDSPDFTDTGTKNLGCMDEGRGNLPKKDDIVEVAAKKTEGGKSFYKIVDHLSMINSCEWGYEKWIPAAQAEYFTDLYEYTKKWNKGVSADILDFTNANLGNALDARSVKVRKVKLRKEPGVEFFEIIAKEGVSSSRGRVPNVPQILYAAKQNGNLSLVGKFDNAELRDIDGDGNLELTTDVSSRESVPLHVYTYTDNGFEQIFSLDSAYGVQSRIEGAYLIIESSLTSPSEKEAELLNPKFKDQSVHAFKLAGGKFTEVAVPEKFRKKNNG